MREIKEEHNLWCLAGAKKLQGLGLVGVMGLMERIGKPIRVRLGIRLDPFLGIKLASLYKEGTCTS
jgi:hypothetical protein